MTSVAAVAAWLDQFAPAKLAEAWDNVGLLWGDPSAEVTRVMACLSVTPASAAEAVAARAELVVTHHPVLFRPVKAVRADTPEGGMLWMLARAGVAILSPHTALDNTEGGINDGLASRLGLVDLGPLRHSPARPEFKVVVFVPRADREAVMAAAFAAGGGRIGNYEQCSYSSSGLGTFFGTEGANPAVGQAGRRETVREWRLEVICPGDRLAAVLAAVRSSHSYEEPAIDVYRLHAPASGPGIGRLGRLPAPESLRGFATRVSHLLRTPALQFAGQPEWKVEKVAIVCGAGDEFVDDAAHAGADVLLTGEARFHRALQAEALGIGLVVAGHHQSERPGVEALAARLAQAFPSLTVWSSRLEADPWKSLTSMP